LSIIESIIFTTHR